MTVFRRKLAILAGVCAAALCIPAAQAQIEDSLFAQAASTTPPPPYALFQYSTLTGSGNTITATWLPVVNSSGATSYKDVTLLFNVDSSGNLTVASGYPKVVASPTPLVNSFRAGKYTAPSTFFGGNGIINVSGPGITSGGSTEWSLATASGAYFETYPASATWYVGPLASNPFAARIKAAGITSTAWSYGIGGYPYGNTWYHGSLLGFSQTGNTITIVTFTNSSTNPAKDFSQPLDQITYTLTP